MKTFLIIICVFLIGLCFINQDAVNIFEIKGLSDVCFVCDDFNLKSVQTERIINTDNEIYVYSSVENAEEICNQVFKKATILYFENQNISDLINDLNAEIIKYENVDNADIIYAYSPFIKECIYLQGKKVNVQIIDDNDKIKAGIPFYYGSF